QVQDVTQRRATAMALEASEEKFSSVFRATPIGLMVSRASDGCIIEVNHEFERIFRVRSDEARDRTTTELGIWESTAARDQFVRRALAAGGLEDQQLPLRSVQGH